jgi:hypothetical protein
MPAMPLPCCAAACYTVASSHTAIHAELKMSFLFMDDCVF